MSIFGFYLPPESGEKITLEITILMALTFYMNMVSDLTPQSSDTPLLGIYFSCIMVMVAASVVRIRKKNKLHEIQTGSDSFSCSLYLQIVTILVLNFHHRQASIHKMPYFIRLIFLQWLPFLLRMSTPGNKVSLQTIKMERKVATQLQLLYSGSKISQSHIQLF